MIENDDVRAEALMYLARCGNVDPLTQLTNLDEVRGSAVAAAVAQFLARPGPAQNLDAVRVLLEAATSSDGPDRHSARLEAARLIGSLPDQFEEQLNALLKDQSPETSYAWPFARPPRSASRLGPARRRAAGGCESLWRRRPTRWSLSAIGRCRRFARRSAPRRARWPCATRFPTCCSAIGTPEAEQLLVEYLLDVDPVFRLRSVSALNKLRQQNGDRRIEHELVETLLSAEILGHYRSYQLLGRLSESDAASAPALPCASLDG